VTNSVVMTEATRTNWALAKRAVRLRDKLLQTRIALGNCLVGLSGVYKSRKPGHF
jgi:hypothetical protein